MLTRSSELLADYGPHGFSGFIVAGLIAAVIAVALYRYGGRRATVLVALVAVGGFLLLGNLAIPLAILGVLAALSLRVSRTGEGHWEAVRNLGTEGLIVIGGLAVYTVTRRLIQSDAEPAYAHADAIIALERALHTFVEPELQSLVLRSEAATRSFNSFYLFGYPAVVSAALLWLWATDEPHYRLLRNAFGVSIVCALATIALLPVAPPRLVPEANVVDTIALYGAAHEFANEYAAMPSLHVGWMTATGIVLGRSIGGALGAVLTPLPGVAMMLTVIVTGNHFWLDGAVGIVFTVVPLYLLASVPARRVASSAQPA